MVPDAYIVGNELMTMEWMNERKPSISLPELAVDSVTNNSGVFYCVTSLATLETLSLFKIVDNLVVPKCCAIGDFIWFPW